MGASTYDACSTRCARSRLRTGTASSKRSSMSVNRCRHEDDWRRVAGSSVPSSCINSPSCAASKPERIFVPDSNPLSKQPENCDQASANSDQFTMEDTEGTEKARKTPCPPCPPWRIDPGGGGLFSRLHQLHEDAVGVLRVDEGLAPVAGAAHAAEGLDPLPAHRLYRS